MNNLSNLSPVAADTLYVKRLIARSTAAFYAKQERDALIYAFGRGVYVKGDLRDERRHVYVHPDAPIAAGEGWHHRPLSSLDGIEPLTAQDVVEAHAAGHPKAAGYGEAVKAYAEAEANLGEARLAVQECEEDYRSRPWARYWLVTTSDGHIHSSCDCSTCNKGKEPTGFALVPYLSGKTAADAVADLGPALCSVCFPEAPVEAKEQARISARLALSLKQHGSEAFQKARQEAAAKAEAKAAARCPGSGEQGEVTGRGYAKCPCCGWSSRSTTGKVAAHRRPRFYAVKKVEYKPDLYWSGTAWGPSTKRVAFESREAALAVEGATDCYRE